MIIERPCDVKSRCTEVFLGIYVTGLDHVGYFALNKYFKEQIHILISRLNLHLWDLACPEIESKDFFF